MSDIVERLRQWSEFGYGVEATATMKEAAAEIERLRAALGDILSYVPHGNLPLNLYDKARAALEGK